MNWTQPAAPRVSGKNPFRLLDGWQTANLAQSLLRADPKESGPALARAVGQKLNLFLAGVERYRYFPAHRTLEDPPTLWQEGASRLLDFGGSGPPVLFVPSLVNRSTIFDLDETCSLMRWLAGQGVSPLLLDWGIPGTAEQGYDLEAYTLRLERAMQAVGVPVALVGYCMGGIFALAATLRHPHRVRRLALMATPWDFHADSPAEAQKVADFFHHALRSGSPLPSGMSSLAAEGEDLFPVDLLQALFAWRDPLAAARKFSRFAQMSSERDHDDMARFVAVEDWLNDGIPLTRAAARDCLVGWYGENRLAQGGWHVAGIPIDPAYVATPTLLFLPERDRIIPPASADALASRLRHRMRVRIPLGHVGLMVSRRAPALVWAPLRDWLCQAQD